MPLHKLAHTSWPFQMMWATFISFVHPQQKIIFSSCLFVFLCHHHWLPRQLLLLSVSHLLLLLFSSLAASLAVRARRSMRSVKCQGLRSRLPTRWRAPLIDRSPSLAPTPASAWLSTWSMLGKKLYCSATEHQAEGGHSGVQGLFTLWAKWEMILCACKVKIMHFDVASDMMISHVLKRNA